MNLFSKAAFALVALLYLFGPAADAAAPDESAGCRGALNTVDAGAPERQAQSTTSIRHLQTESHLVRMWNRYRIREAQRLLGVPFLSVPLKQALRNGVTAGDALTRLATPEEVEALEKRGSLQRLANLFGDRISVRWFLRHKRKYNYATRLMGSHSGRWRIQRMKTGYYARLRRTTLSDIRPSFDGLFQEQLGDFSPPRRFFDRFYAEPVFPHLDLDGNELWSLPVRYFYVQDGEVRHRTLALEAFVTLYMVEVFRQSLPRENSVVQEILSSIEDTVGHPRIDHLSLRVWMITTMTLHAHGDPDNLLAFLGEFLVLGMIADELDEGLRVALSIEAAPNVSEIDAPTSFDLQVTQADSAEVVRLVEVKSIQTPWQDPAQLNRPVRNTLRKIREGAARVGERGITKDLFILVPEEGFVQNSAWENTHGSFLLDLRTGILLKEIGSRVFDSDFFEKTLEHLQLLPDLALLDSITVGTFSRQPSPIVRFKNEGGVWRVERTRP